MFDVVENLGNRIEHLRKRFITEVDRLFHDNRRKYELAQDQRIDDHEMFHDRIEKKDSNLNDRLVELDETIVTLNEIEPNRCA